MTPFVPLHLDLMAMPYIRTIHTSPVLLHKAKEIGYSVSIIYGNIAIFMDLEAFLTPKSGGKSTKSAMHYWIYPWFWSRPPGLSWIKRIDFLTFIAYQSHTNGYFQNFPAAFSSSFIELQ